MSDPAAAPPLRIDLLGAIPIFIAGALLHFAYRWSGAWPPAALFAAVNASGWEHLKIAFWPALFWAALLATARRRGESGYWAARGYGLLTMCLTIILLFYGYTALLGDNLLSIDIATFALAILVGQAVAQLAQPLTRAQLNLRRIGLALVAAQIAAFALFTYAPPRLPLFEDGRNGRYGLAAYEAAVDHRGE